MDISEHIKKLQDERDECEATKKKAHSRIVEIDGKLRQLETQKKKFLAILGEGQKGAAE